MNLRSVVLLNDAAFVDGGGSQVAISSAAGLAARGYDVAVVAAKGPVCKELRACVHVRCTNQSSIAEDRNHLRALAQGLWNPEAGDAVRDELRHRDPASTVVHVHGWTKALSSSALRAAVDMGFRVVLTLHDYFVACPNGCFYDHQSKEICARSAMSLSCIRTNCDSRSYAVKIYRIGRQFVQQHLGGIPPLIRDYIYVSGTSYRVLKSYLPKGARTYAVRNPIDISHEQAVDPAANDSFLYVGRLSPEKGAALLAAAAARADVPLTLVGDGDERDRVVRANPAAVVTGWLSRDGVRDHFRHARALVVPSLWYEALSLVVLEAAAVGIPSIVPDRCAASELVSHARTGLIFRIGSLASLTESLVQMRDNALVRSAGAQAYATYWQKPSTLDAHLDALVDVYERVLAG